MYSTAKYRRRERICVNVYESHLSQVGCRGMSSEEFSRAPRSRCQIRVRLRGCHECLTRVPRREILPQAAVTPREVKTQRTRDAPLRRFFSFLSFFFFSSTDHLTSRHLAFRERSHSAEGSRTHLLHETTFLSQIRRRMSYVRLLLL